MKAKTISNKITHHWKNNGYYTAIYADGSCIRVPMPDKADPEGLIGVYNRVSQLQIIEDFAAAGLELT